MNTHFFMRPFFYSKYGNDINSVTKKIKIQYVLRKSLFNIIVTTEMTVPPEC